MRSYYQSIFVLFVFVCGVSGIRAQHTSVQTDEIEFLSEKTLEIHQILSRADALQASYTDSACLLAWEAFHLAEDEDSRFYKIQALMQLGKIYNRLGSSLKAFENLMLALSIAEEEPYGQMSKKDLHQYSQLLNEVGRSYYFLDNPEKSLTIYKKALEVAKYCAGDSADYASTRLVARVYNSIGSVYVVFKEFDKASNYYIKALEMIEPDSSPLEYADLLNNIGITYKEKGNVEKAIEYHNYAYTIREREKDTVGLIKSLNNIGMAHMVAGNLKEGIRWAKKALYYADMQHNFHSARVSTEGISEAYKELGDYRSALHFYQRFKVLNDSVINSESINRMSQMEKQLAIEKQLREQELEREIQKQINSRKRLIYFIILGAVVLSLLILGLLFYAQRNKIKHQQLMHSHLELESHNLSLEKEKLKSELEFRNKELATNVMYLVNRNEQITRIGEKLIKNKGIFKTEGQKVVQEIIQELNAASSMDAWKEFEIRFQQVHTDFYKKLLDAVPNLTLNERKLCAFLRLNMTTKEISAITFQSVNSIIMARSRLRKKLGMDRDENLIAFLERIE